MADAHINFGYGVVATAPSPAASGTTATLTVGDEILNGTPPFNATIWPNSAQPLKSNSEIIRITAIDTGTRVITFARTQEGTTARTIVVGDQIAATVTKKTLNDVEDTVNTVFNVIGPTYGAKGDGSTNDSTAIQAAITAAQAAGGGVVYLPTGTYIINTTLTISADNVTIQGAGWGTVLKPITNLNDNIITIDNTALRKNLKFCDFKIDGNRLNQSTSGKGISGAAASSTFDRIWFSSIKTTGLDLTGTAGASFGFTNQIIRCLFDTQTPTAISMVNNDENYIAGNVFNDITTSCITDTAGTQVIENNIFVGGGSTTTGLGIQLTSGSSIVRGNVFDGIHEQHVKATGDYNLIVNNRCSKLSGGTASVPAVQIVSGSNNRVMGNIITGGTNYTYAVDTSGATNTELLNNYAEAGTTAKYNNAASTGALYFNGGNLGLNTQTADEKFVVNGNLKLKDADTATKAYRFRTSGGSLDFDFAGATLYLSGYPNADFSGTQRFYLGLDTGGNANAFGVWRYQTGVSGTTKVTIDTGANVVIAVVGGISATTSITSSGTTGIGYATGAGGTVAQATSKSTGVTLNAACGTITLNAAALAAATTVSFTLTNSAIAATDVVVIQHSSVGTLGAYNFAVTPAAGSASIAVRNVHTASLSEAIVLRFAVIKAVTS